MNVQVSRMADYDNFESDRFRKIVDGDVPLIAQSPVVVAPVAA